MSNTALRWNFIYDKFPGLTALLHEEITKKIEHGAEELNIEGDLSPDDLAYLIHDGVCSVLYDYLNRKEALEDRRWDLLP